MTMKEWPDKRLDELFRKSAGEFKPEYDPNDWASLRTRLDAQEKPLERPWWKKALPGIIAALLMGSIGGVTGYLFTHESETEKSVNQPVVKGTASSGVGKDIEKKGEEKNELTNGVIEQRVLPRSRPKAGGVRLRAARSESGRGAGAFFNSATDDGAHVRVNAGKERNATQLFDDFKGGALDKSRKQEEEGMDPSGLARDTGPDPVEPVRLEVRLDIQPVPIGPRNLTFAPVQRKIPAVVVLDSISAEPADRTLPVAHPRWAVRLGVAPDLSTVGLKNFSAPKTAFSFLIEYGVGARFFVQSGAVRSLKVYSATAGDYQLPSGVKQSVYLSTVDGRCVVLEVPVNLKYTVIDRRNYNGFVSGGLSSYQMRKEKYDYHYDKYYQGANYGWSGKTGWYWLSHANVSVGYEHKITQRLSLVAEPYLRLPLKRVGYGKVNLITTGAWLSIRYAPLRTK
jgi:hypothetical protein